ncbi:MAG: hypothetical protein IT379_06985 [Deltaproteobacteria bacterium]|nr:hypothetical protein [Deltaproteobacteria bacterium]
MPGSWRFTMSADDVFAHPKKWQSISRATAVSIHWRIPVVTTPDGTSGGAVWFDELSPYFHGANAAPLEGIRYWRYLGTPPQISGPPALGPAPQESSAEQPPVEEQKFWLNVVVVDEFGDFVSNLGVSVVGPGGAKGGGTTDGKGRAVINNLKPGKSKVSIGKHLFFTDESKAGTFVKPEEVSHTMTEAESLGGIARKFGTTDGRSIYYYSANSALKGKRAALGLVQAKDTFKVPKTFVYEFPNKPDGEAHEYTLKVPAMLDITKVDPQFAPSAETLDIHYDLAFLSKQKVILEISSPHLDGGAPLFKQELKANEKADGSRVFKWDGVANQGKIKDKHISPLHTPYKVKLYVDGKAQHTDEREFQVLFHSIELRRGPWTPDEAAPKESDEKSWVQYQLNELGFWGGPVGKDTDKYLEKAIIRYKVNHKDFHQLDASNYNGNIDAALKAALKAKANARPYLTGDAITNAKGESKIRVEAITYEKGEFGGTLKASKEKDRVNRPLIPIEVDIFLRGKPAGKDPGPKKRAPGGVGPAQIEWRFTEKSENLDLQFADIPAHKGYPRTYIEKAKKVHGGSADNDNCPKELGGIREPAATNYKTAWFVGDQYIPYVVKDDAGQKCVYSQAWVDKPLMGADGKPVKDKAGKQVFEHDLRRGRAGVYFRPSYVAGDDYQLSATLVFRKDTADLPNKADLEKRHGLDAKKKITDSTGRFRVERYAKVAYQINWPARTNSSQWPEIAVEFAKAYIDLDIGSITKKKISEVITEAEYEAVITANTAHNDPAKIRLYDDALVGVDLPAPAAGEALADYRETTISQYVDDNYWGLITTPMQELLSKKIRKTHPVGFIVVDFLTHKPIDLTATYSAADFTAYGERADLKPADRTKFIKWTSSYGKADSLIFADQKDPDKVYYVVAHEMGHNFWLRHYEVPASNGPQPGDHDTRDHNCAMTYSKTPPAYMAQGVYTPHFCGKCNLKLRGWDAHAATMLASST